MSGRVARNSHPVLYCSYSLLFMVLVLLFRIRAFTLDLWCCYQASERLSDRVSDTLGWTKAVGQGTFISVLEVSELIAGLRVGGIP